MNAIKKIRKYYNEKKRFNYFLKHLTNLEIKDNLNRLSERPHKSILRILGNGNSLNEMLDSFSDEDDIDYMVVNRHVLSDSYIQLKPNYYVLADPHFFTNSEGISILEKIKEKTTWQLEIFLPYSKENKRKFFDFFQENTFITLTFYNMNEYYGPEEHRQFAYDHNLAMPSAQNVLVPSIYVGICINYNNIELFGVEHNWTKYLFVNDNNDVCLEDIHFYDKDKINYRVMKKATGSLFKIHEALNMYARMFQSYWELQEIAKQKEISIINYTPNSFIDAFNRK